MKYLIVVGVLTIFVGFVVSCSDHPKTEEKSNANVGRKIFREQCILCHGANGKLGLNGAKDLTVSTLNMEERIYQITNGKNAMTPYKDVLDPEEIKAVAEYTVRFNPNL